MPLLITLALILLANIVIVIAKRDELKKISLLHGFIEYEFRKKRCRPRK